jgi:flagellar basal body-associated protein FliL
MDISMIIILALVVVAVLAIAAAVWFYMQKQQTNRLRSKFGPEYNRAIRSEGDAKRAEQALHEREKRVEKLNIRILTASERENFARAWEQEQARFVDEPAIAVNNADRLVQKVMSARGYPVTDFEQRVADVSVDHPVVVQNYRVAHDIAVRGQNIEVSTEELREAMIHYRALFAELLDDGAAHPVRQVMPEDNARDGRAKGKARAKGAGR